MSETRKYRNMMNKLAKIIDKYMDIAGIESGETFGTHLIWRNCLLGDLRDYIYMRDSAKNNFGKREASHEPLRRV